LARHYGKIAEQKLSAGAKGVEAFCPEIKVNWLLCIIYDQHLIQLLAVAMAMDPSAVCTPVT
jgi:hypothetical protein